MLSVVGDNTYYTYTKMGVGKRPDATFWGTHNDGWIWNLIKGLGSIFYKRSVVGNNTYSIYTKMGARIHRTVALRMRTHTHTITKREPEITGSQIYTAICGEFSKRPANVPTN